MSSRSLGEQVADLEREVQRGRVEREILLEGCVLYREVMAKSVQATVLAKTISLVMKDTKAMQDEIDLRILDPKRSWWNEVNK